VFNFYLKMDLSTSSIHDIRHNTLSILVTYVFL